MPLPPGNHNSRCSSRTKLWVEVLIPREKAVIQMTWFMLRKCLGGQCLRFHSCVQQISAYSSYMLFALWKERVAGEIHQLEPKSFVLTWLFGLACLFQYLWPSVASLLRFLPYRDSMGIKCIEWAFIWTVSKFLHTEVKRKGIEPAAKKEYIPCDQLFQHSVVAYDPADLFLHIYNNTPAVLTGIYFLLT